MAKTTTEPEKQGLRWHSATSGNWPCCLRLRAGDREAREQLVEQFMPLARNLARRYNNSSEPYEDLCQVAHVGLLKAIDGYDPDRGLPFQAFAIPTILGELRRYFRNCTWSVHVPRGAQERALELRGAERALSESHGRAPTVTEIAQFMELSIEQVIDALQALHGYSSMSLDAPRGSDTGDEDFSYADSVGEEDPRCELVELDASLAGPLQTLKPRNREILRMRFFEELTQTQIAERIGISQMQVSRLLSKSIAQLRETALAQI